MDNTAVTKLLLGTWFETAIDKDRSEKERKRATKDVYGLLFLCWLVTENQHKKIFVATNGVRNIFNLAKRYVDIGDPMSLDSLYEGDHLGAQGYWRVDSFPLINSEKIFKNKQAYHALVDKFLGWEKQLR